MPIKFKINDKISLSRKLVLLALSIILAVCFILTSYRATRAAAGVPKMISYQGKLTNANGSFVSDGSYNMKISIYDVSSGGTPLWTWKGTTGSPQAVSVTVSGGIFSAMLGDTSFGSTNALNLDFNADTYYLGLTVGADSEMTPRKRIGASGYAINVDTLDGNHIGSVAVQGDILYGSAAGIFSVLTKDANVTRYIRNTGTSNNPAWAQVNVANGVTGTLPIANGGTNATDAATARTNLTAAASGNNSDITSLTGLNQQGSLVLLPYNTSAGNTSEIRFRELAAGGTDYVGFKAPDSIASSKIWTMPGADGLSGQLLSTDGSGNLAFSSLKNLVQSFTVDTSQSITAGDVVSFVNNSGAKLRKGFNATGYGSEFVFNAANTTTYTYAAALSSDKFVVVFRDSTNYGSAIIGTVNGDIISWGSKYIFSSGLSTTWPGSVSALSSDKFVVAYEDNGDTNYGNAKIGTVSGTVITFGSAARFNAGNATTYISVATLYSDKFVVVYRDEADSYKGNSIIGTVSVTTISYGSEYTFHSAANTGWTFVSVLTPEKFVVGYENDSTGAGYAIIGTLANYAGTAITYGSAVVFNNTALGINATAYITVASLDSGTFVVGFKDQSNSWYAEAIIGTVSGTTITFGGSKYAATSYSVDYTYLTALSSTKFAMVWYASGAGSTYGNSKIGTVSGTTITFNSEVTFNSASSGYTSVIALYSEKFVVTFEDAGNSNYGTATVGTISGPAIGISRETKTDGQTCAVTIKGVSDVHSALTVGAVYYASPDGTLTTTAYPSRAGIAVSATEILLDGRWTDQDQIFADLLFKNNFKVIESYNNGQSLSFMNQGNKQIMSLNEKGNLSIPGFLRSSNLQIGNNHLIVAKNGNVGVGTNKPLSKLDIVGDYGVNQLRLRKPYTPKFQFDVFSNIGSFSWDESLLYIKTNNGWKGLEKDNW